MASSQIATLTGNEQYAIHGNDANAFYNDFMGRLRNSDYGFLEGLLGAPDPSKDFEQMVSDKRSPVTIKTLDEAYRGKSLLVSNYVNQNISNYRSGWHNKAMPMEQTDNLSDRVVTITTFGDELPHELPDLATVRQVTFSQDEKRFQIRAYGLGASVSVNFLKTPAGPSIFKGLINSISNAMNNIAKLTILYACITAKDSLKHRNYHMGKGPSCEAIFKLENENFCILNKQEKGMFTLNRYVEQMRSKNNARPATMVIFPSGAKQQILYGNDYLTEFNRSGPGALARLDNGDQFFAQAMGLSIYEYNPQQFQNTGSTKAGNLMERVRQIGFYYLVGNSNYRNVRGGIRSAQSKNDIQILNWDKSDVAWDTICYEDLIQNDLYFNANDGNLNYGKLLELANRYTEFYARSGLNIPITKNGGNAIDPHIVTLENGANHPITYFGEMDFHYMSPDLYKGVACSCMEYLESSPSLGTDILHSIRKLVDLLDSEYRWLGTVTGTEDNQPRKLVNDFFNSFKDQNVGQYGVPDLPNKNNVVVSGHLPPGYNTILHAIYLVENESSMSSQVSDSPGKWKILKEGVSAALKFGREMVNVWNNRSAVSDLRNMMFDPLILPSWVNSGDGKFVNDPAIVFLANTLDSHKFGVHIGDIRSDDDGDDIDITEPTYQGIVNAVVTNPKSEARNRFNQLVNDQVEMNNLSKNQSAFDDYNGMETAIINSADGDDQKTHFITNKVVSAVMNQKQPSPVKKSEFDSIVRSYKTGNNYQIHEIGRKRGRYGSRNLFDGNTATSKRARKVVNLGVPASYFIFNENNENTAFPMDPANPGNVLIGDNIKKYSMGQMRAPQSSVADLVGNDLSTKQSIFSYRNHSNAHYMANRGYDMSSSMHSGDHFRSNRLHLTNDHTSISMHTGSGIREGRESLVLEHMRLFEDNKHFKARVVMAANCTDPVRSACMFAFLGQPIQRDCLKALSKYVEIPRYYLIFQPHITLATYCAIFLVENIGKLLYAYPDLVAGFDTNIKKLSIRAESQMGAVILSENDITVVPDVVLAKYYWGAGTNFYTPSDFAEHHPNALGKFDGDLRRNMASELNSPPKASLYSICAGITKPNLPDPIDITGKYSEGSFRRTDINGPESGAYNTPSYPSAVYLSMVVPEVNGSDNVQRTDYDSYYDMSRKFRKNTVCFQGAKREWNPESFRFEWEIQSTGLLSGLRPGISSVINGLPGLLKEQGRIFTQVK